MFCKYCGKPLDENFHCPSCGRSMIPTGRSNELDELLSSGLSGSAQTELDRAREEGYRDGYKGGCSSGEDSAKRAMNKRKRVIAVVALAVYVLSVAVAGGVSFSLGKRKGSSDALASLPTSTPLSTAVVMPTSSPSAAPTPSLTIAETASPAPSLPVVSTTAPVLSTNPESTPPVEVIQLGNKGGNVTGIQKCLRALGYKVDVDEVFGAETADAVKKFQGKHDLEETGSVDLSTLCAILSDMAETQANQVTDTPTAGTSDTTVEAPGTTESPTPSEAATTVTTPPTNPTASSER